MINIKPENMYDRHLDELMFIKIVQRILKEMEFIYLQDCQQMNMMNQLNILNIIKDIEII